MAGIAGLIVIDRLLHLEYFAIPLYLVYPFVPVVDEQLVVIVIYRFPHLFGVR
jgi:hypothetical protein